MGPKPHSCYLKYHKTNCKNLHLQPATATFSTKRRLFPQKAAMHGPRQGAPPMKRILLSASLALALSGSLVFAQSTTTPAPEGKHFHHHRPNPQQEAAWLSTKLNLSSDQTAKLEPILADRDQKMTALWSNTSTQPRGKETADAHHPPGSQAAALHRPHPRSDRADEVHAPRPRRSAPPTIPDRTAIRPLTKPGWQIPRSK